MLPAIRLVHRGGKMNGNRNGTTALELVLSWGFIGLPLARGEAETIMNAMKLFK